MCNWKTTVYVYEMTKKDSGQKKHIRWESSLGIIQLTVEHLSGVLGCSDPSKDTRHRLQLLTIIGLSCQTKLICSVFVRFDFFDPIHPSNMGIIQPTAEHLSGALI